MQKTLSSVENTHLKVGRTFSNGTKHWVGELFQYEGNIYFRYNEAYLNAFPKGNLSPFRLRWSTNSTRGPDRPNEGLHSCFADSLPDGC